VAVALGLAGCGEGSKTGSTQLSPTQYDNEQQVGGYVKALHQILAPTAHPPTEPTNYAKARQVLQTSLNELKAVAPPPQFRVFHAKFIRGVQEELATLPAFERGQRTHNAVLINTAEEADLKAEHVVREALAEGETMLNKCKHDSFSC
jgi:hypothetical protein